MIKSNFRDWTLDKIDASFQLQQADNNECLNNWLALPFPLLEWERIAVNLLQKKMNLGLNGWNEVELENKFISPLFMLADIDNKQFAYFLEREITANIGKYELIGRVDGMIATGFRNPQKPYFCMNEYKGEVDPTGDPAGQCLIAMLVAQALNNHDALIYGCYIIGKMWQFIVLEGSNYTISKSFNADDEEIFDIYRILKGLKEIIQKQIEKI